MPIQGTSIEADDILGKKQQLKGRQFQQILKWRGMIIIKMTTRKGIEEVTLKELVWMMAGVTLYVTVIFFARLVTRKLMKNVVNSKNVIYWMQIAASA